MKPCVAVHETPHRQSDMFDVPNAKRVRRHDLYGSSSDAGSHSQSDAEDDAELRAKLNERLSSLLGLDLSTPAVASEAQPDPVEDVQAAVVQAPDEHGAQAEKQAEKQAEEFEFRLFSTSAKTAAPVKVVLAASDDEDADLGNGAFTVPERPSSFYLSSAPTLEQIERYRQIALAGDDVLLGARKRAWGLERPWRVIRIDPSGKLVQGTTANTSTAKHPPKLSSGLEVNEEEKRKRPGKKRRIALRIKAKAEKERREAEASQKLTKEEHLKEKKKRLNREKKLKRRAKEREQKLAGKGQDGSQPAPSEPADSDSDD